MSFFQKFKAGFSQKSKSKDTVFALYNYLVEEARNPKLYKTYGVPDTLDGRFDCIVFHMALFGLATNETLKGKPLETIGPDLIAVFLKDMDRNLREIGVGDLSVGKKVKKMASALFGRVDAYRNALIQKDQKTALCKALEKNLYRGENFKKSQSLGLSEYGIKKFLAWKNLPYQAIENGKFF